MKPSLLTMVAAALHTTVCAQGTAPPLAFAFSNRARARQLVQHNSPFGVEKNDFRFPRQLTAGRRRRRQWSRSKNILFSFKYDDDENEELSSFKEYEEESKEDAELGKTDDISRLEALEDLLMELENDMETLLNDDEDDTELDEDDFDDDTDVEALLSFLGGEYDDDYDFDFERRYDRGYDGSYTTDGNPISSLASGLEQALMQGVVPVSAGVGSDALPGDWGFDPLNLANKDYIHQAQYILLQSLPGAVKEDPPPPRPSALILRDYREAEIRHGRLAMLAAMFWPLQEMLDKLLLDDDQFGPLIYGPVTLPYFPLLMTLIMMLLGYLDIYAKAIQEKDNIGEAYLPGDCFWDPLFILQGAPASMKRNMQERELFNGRVAMLAFAAYTFEEATTHLPVISVEGNELLFLPAYQVPYIQEYLDQLFS